MKLYRVKSLATGLLALSLAYFSPLLAEEGKNAASPPVPDDYFVGYTPMSPSVWNSFSEEPDSESQIRDYVFRDAYLVEANNTYLKDQGKMFTIPTDDLTSTQRRMLSPYGKEEEEKSRRDYAETVKSIVVNKGVPEYTLQLLGLQKLREGVKKIERAVSIDVAVAGKASDRNSQPWKFKSALLPYQRSYKLYVTNTVWNMEVQGGYTTSKGDRLYADVSARLGRFLQVNTYQFLTNTAFSTISFFYRPQLSFSASVRKEFVDDPSTPGDLIESVGMNYIF